MVLHSRKCVKREEGVVILTVGVAIRRGFVRGGRYGGIVQVGFVDVVFGGGGVLTCPRRGRGLVIGKRICRCFNGRVSGRYGKNLMENP